MCFAEPVIDAGHGIAALDHAAGREISLIAPDQGPL